MNTTMRFDAMKRFKEELKDDEKNKVDVVFTKTQHKLNSISDQIQDMHQNVRKG